MATIHHQLLIKAPVARVYEPIATADGISTWWDRQTAVPTARGLVLEHNPGPEHGMVKLRVVEQVPNTRIEVGVHQHSSPEQPGLRMDRHPFHLRHGRGPR
jgi:uncharacterized protein YndB with AHSA1/START domain